MKEKVILVNDKKDWRFWALLSFGIFILLNSFIWIIMNGGRWFETIPQGENKIPEYYNDINRVFGSFYMLAYFTVQTNLFLGIMLIILAFSYYSEKTQSWFFGSVSLITVTFIVYWAILAPTAKPENWSNSYFVISNTFLHGVNPILGFVILVLIRKEIILDKKVLGWCSMYMMIFFIFNAILYGSGAIVDKENPSKIDGASVYNFLDLQKLMFIDFSKMPVVGIFANILLLILCPLLPIGFNWIWIKVLSLKTNNNPYFYWMVKAKNNLKDLFRR